MTIELTQTQHAHTVYVSDEWEYNGQTFTCEQDTDAECPIQQLDDASALCVIGAPRGSILHNPADTNCPAMWEFDNFHEEHGRIPTQEEWEALCPDYWVLVGWHTQLDSRLFAVAFNKDVYPTDPCESWVHKYSMWADGYVWVVSNETTGDSLAGIYAVSEEDAIRNYIENYM